MKTIVLATHNKGKVAEIGAILSNLQPDLEVVGLDAFPEIGDIPETGNTFEANALQKAEAVTRATGLTALADDSGLEVDALHGAPGVMSARYSGENATDETNNQKLLKALQDVPEGQRRARFKCVLVVLTPEGRKLTAQGTWEGEIARAPRGDGGFGYDPLFVDPELGRTSAELSSQEKNARSHRGRALKSLISKWPGFCT